MIKEVIGTGETEQEALENAKSQLELGEDAEYDFEANKEDRLSWGVFRDRRPEMYTDLF